MLTRHLPVPGPAADTPYPDHGEQLQAVGWGSTDTDNTQVAYALHDVGLPAVDLERCAQQWSYAGAGAGVISQGHLCAGEAGNGCCVLVLAPGHAAAVQSHTTRVYIQLPAADSQLFPAPSSSRSPPSAACRPAVPAEYLLRRLWRPAAAPGRQRGQRRAAGHHQLLLSRVRTAGHAQRVHLPATLQVSMAQQRCRGPWNAGLVAKQLQGR